MSARWLEHANCAGMDTDLFFPVANPWQEREAKRVCSGCTVRLECLTYAMTSNGGRREQHGIFGGINMERQGEVRRRESVA